MKKIYFLFLSIICLTSCDDMRNEDFKQNFSNTDSIQGTEILILCEGSYNGNNSTLASFNIKSQELTTDIFKKVNQRGLGDSANKMKIYGGKLYIITTGSSQIEVIDVQTKAVIHQIKMFNEKSVAREPRSIEFDKNKAYVCNFDGTVARIDTTTLEIDNLITVGKNPDDICKAGNSLYVSNSGGLDWPNYDNTVSVIDIATFSEKQKITVAENPGNIVADSEGDVYVVSRGDFSSQESYVLQRIDTKTNTVAETFSNLHPCNIYLANDNAYIYSVNYATNEFWISVLDCKTETIKREKFITDNTNLSIPYSISIDKTTNQIFICDAKDYVTYGDVFCFNEGGKLLYKIESVGLNPNTVIFR